MLLDVHSCTHFNSHVFDFCSNNNNSSSTANYNWQTNKWTERAYTIMCQRNSTILWTIVYCSPENFQFIIKKCTTKKNARPHKISEQYRMSTHSAHLIRASTIHAEQTPNEFEIFKMKRSRLELWFFQFWKCAERRRERAPYYDNISGGGWWWQ